MSSNNDEARRCGNSYRQHCARPEHCGECITHRPEHPRSKTTQQALRLTDAQWDVIVHRLEVSDALADVLGIGDANPEAVHAREDVEEVADLLRVGKWAEANEINPTIVRDVLRDCVEGSTYCGSIEDEDALTRHRIYRTIEAAARKVGEFLGEDVQPVML